MLIPGLTFVLVLGIVLGMYWVFVDAPRTCHRSGTAQAPGGGDVAIGEFAPACSGRPSG